MRTEERKKKKKRKNAQNINEFNTTLEIRRRPFGCLRDHFLLGDFFLRSERAANVQLAINTLRLMTINRQRRHSVLFSLEEKPIAPFSSLARRDSALLPACSVAAKRLALPRYEYINYDSFYSQHHSWVTFFSSVHCRFFHSSRSAAMCLAFADGSMGRHTVQSGRNKRILRGKAKKERSEEEERALLFIYTVSLCRFEQRASHALTADLEKSVHMMIRIM